MIDNIDGKQCVEVFRLTELDERNSYEILLNNPNIKVIRDNFTYDKKGNPVITVWYIKEFEESEEVAVLDDLNDFGFDMLKEPEEPTGRLIKEGKEGG